jgi:hypothetical protein
MGGKTSNQNDRNRECTEAKGIARRERATFTRFQSSLVDVGAVGAAEILDLESTRASPRMNHGVTRGGRGMVDFQVEVSIRTLATNERLALMNGPELPEGVAVERDEKRCQHLGRVCWYLIGFERRYHRGCRGRNDGRRRRFGRRWRRRDRKRSRWRDRWRSRRRDWWSRGW